MSKVASIIRLLTAPDKILLSELARNKISNLSGVEVGSSKIRLLNTFQNKNDILSIELVQVIIHPIAKQIARKTYMLMGGRGGGGGGEEAKVPARFNNAAAAVSGIAL